MAESLGLSRRRRTALWAMAFIALLTLITAVVLGAYAFLNYRFNTDGPVVAETVFEVPKGAGLSRVAGDLAASGLISDADVFKLVMKLQDRETGLKAGEYIILPGASMADIASLIESGKSILYRVTVPEGLTSAQIVRALDGVEQLVDDNPKVPAEGTLLPETYSFPRGTTQGEILTQMAAAQDATMAELWPNRQPDIPVTTPEAAIILASVVEKETGVGAERAKVAGVFTNRLRRGIRLESDPTIIYGVSQGEPLGRGLRRSEIDTKTAWNTYQIDGLPPTPIANPGRAAIAAVLNPAETDAIFFVADGTGGHTFSRTLAEHNRAVRRWRQIERERKPR